jgi:kynureninase
MQADQRGIDRQRCLELDRTDPLAGLRDQFTIIDGLIYLDGNSLGPLPAATPARVQEATTVEWGRDLIGSWNTHDWIQLPGLIGNKIARLVGARDNELVVADSTSVNLFKVLTAAAQIARRRSPGRTEIVSERLNFPTDLYIADSVAAANGLTLRLVDIDPATGVDVVVDDSTAIVLFTHVDYRTGRMHDMAGATRAAHDAGALMVWDLAHSAGAVPVDLRAADADFAIGCGYKYLNGGPGAPAFVWVNPRHVDEPQPLRGWLGHAAPFDFTPDYFPAAGILGYQCGTPPILSMVALECGVDTVLAAEAYGGMAALRAKSLALTSMLMELLEPIAAAHGLRVVTPTEPSVRGSQVSFAAPEGAYNIVQALIARGVVGDFRAPDIARFGCVPLYTRFVDIWDAVEHIRAVLDTGEWREPRFAARAAVT